MASQVLTAGRRAISNGNEFNSLFPLPLNTDPIVNSNGDLDFTLLKMAQYAEKGRSQVAKIAPMLQGKTVEETCKNIHGFLVKYIQYDQDKPGIEQLRSPSRTWQDRKQGVDCDCQSIFASALLREMKPAITHNFRIVKFGGSDFEHVYIVVPRTGGGQIILDGVIHQFDTEKSYSQAQDYTMTGKKTQLLNGIPVQYLNGLGNANQRVHSEIEISELSRKLKLFLMAQREAIQKNTQQVSHVNPVQAVTNINFALSAWDNPVQRKAAVEQLALKEQQYNHETQFFRTVLAFLNGAVHCNQVCASGYVNLSPEVMQQVQSGLGTLGSAGYTDGEKRTHGVAKTAAVIVRGAYLGLLRLNFRNMADKIAPAYFPVNVAGAPNDAPWYVDAIGTTTNTTGNPVFPKTNYNQVYTQKFGLSASEHLHLREVLFNNLLKKWYLWGGDWDSFKNTALKGAHKMLVGSRSLPGYQYWCRYDDYYLHPAPGTDPDAITPQWREIDGLREINGLGNLGCIDPATGTACTVITFITAASPLIVALKPLMDLLRNPKGAAALNPDGSPIETVDPNTGQPAPTNPTTNPDPSSHPAAIIDATTGLWTDKNSKTYFDPVTKSWKQVPGSSVAKYGLIGAAVLALGAGIYFLIPGSKSKK